MDVRVAAQIALLTRVDPTPQTESQRPGLWLGQINLCLKREGFETSPDVYHQASGAGIQDESSIHVASTFAQVIDVGMFAFNFESLSISISKRQRGGNRLVGFVIQDASFQLVRAPAFVRQQQKN